MNDQVQNAAEQYLAELDEAIASPGADLETLRNQVRETLSRLIVRDDELKTRICKLQEMEKESQDDNTSEG